ncbi:hypothetical protein EVAR_21181_1 [Eumeta japonica]|uniref:Uncharacterized protein n=1 Tax=Eumeta variegata TaxID=151549 RepID=A0A4C1UNN4_EUMVA|nr:hypothetical protein EVAR_21181_1 [Eumeta japonica]
MSAVTLLTSSVGGVRSEEALPRNDYVIAFTSARDGGSAAEGRGGGARPRFRPDSVNFHEIKQRNNEAAHLHRPTLSQAFEHKRTERRAAGWETSRSAAPSGAVTVRPCACAGRRRCRHIVIN